MMCEALISSAVCATAGVVAIAASIYDLTHNDCKEQYTNKSHKVRGKKPCEKIVLCPWNPTGWDIGKYSEGYEQFK